MRANPIIRILEILIQLRIQTFLCMLQDFNKYKMKFTLDFVLLVRRRPTVQQNMR